MRNECLSAALDELNAAGIRDVSHARGAKHWQIRWGANGTTRVYSLPGTPSDYRSGAKMSARMSAACSAKTACSSIASRRARGRPID